MNSTKENKVDRVKEASKGVTKNIRSLSELTLEPSRQITKARATIALNEWMAVAKTLTQALNNLADTDKQPLKLRPLTQSAILLKAIGEFLADDLSREFTVKDLRNGNVYGFNKFTLMSGSRHDQIGVLINAHALERVEYGKYVLTKAAINYIKQNQPKDTKKTIKN